jgi:hypothetical protein
LQSNTSSITITIDAQDPSTLEVNKTITSNTPTNITLLGSDPQNSQLEYFITSPTNGTISGNAPNIVYTPATNYIGLDSFNYYVTNLYGLTSNESPVNINVMPNNPPIICFNEDTLILAYINNVEKYVKIQDIVLGTRVKTMHNQYLPVVVIGKKDICNSEDNVRIKDRLYKITKSDHPELNQDLILTGGHHILVNKCFVPACMYKKSQIYHYSGKKTIYHISLRNVSQHKIYGIFANGMIAESCSIHSLLFFSQMDIITDIKYLGKIYKPVDKKNKKYMLKIKYK